VYIRNQGWGCINGKRLSLCKGVKESERLAQVAEQLEKKKKKRKKNEG